jgi:hypothetical protein
MTAKPTFEMSSSTRLLRQRLAQTKVGDVVSYAELSRVISEPVDGSTSSLQTSLRSLLRNERMVFGSIRGVGVKRLADSEIVAASSSDIDGIRRKARKSVMKITAVQNFTGLSPKDQMAHTSRLSIFAVVASMASDQGVKKIEAAVGGRSSELPIAETLKAFGSV